MRCQIMRCTVMTRHDINQLLVPPPSLPTNPTPRTDHDDSARKPRTPAGGAGAEQHRCRVPAQRAPLPAPLADEIIVNNRAVTVNSIDWAVQDAGSLADSWIKYLLFLVSDASRDTRSKARTGARSSS